jgi:hypothetical protein
MNEFFNWHDTLIVASHNWYWLLFAFICGMFFAWFTSRDPDVPNT